MSQLTRKRINLDLPYSQFTEMAKIIDTMKTNLSDFVREAIRKHIERIKWEELEKELAEGYIANAELDLKTCDDFKYVDGENI